MISVVTGGAGFLGSHLVDSLLAAGDEVVIIDNLSTGNLRNVASATETGRATFVYLDVAQSAETIKASLDVVLANRRIGRIFHLASPASPEAYSAHQWETLAVNGLGTMSLIEIALEHAARFVFSSTSEIYGDPLVHPQPESYFGNVDPIGPRSCYDEGKRFGEAAIAAAVRTRGLDARIVRFFNCYGPRMEIGDGRLIPEFAQALIAGRPLPIQGSGKQTRSLTYVDDGIELLRIVAERKDLVLQPVNVGNDDERSVEDIGRTFARVVGVDFEAEYRPGREQDPQRRRPDLTLARSMGWMPKVEMDEGLRRTYSWFNTERLAYA